MKIFLILTAALLLRLINLNQSLWLDEAINTVYSQKYNFWDFLTVYSLGDFHPPLYFGILWIWTHLFGTSEIIVRIPSVIFGILTVWLTYLIGKKLFSEKAALVAAAILAFNPLHVYYSQEARMYSLAAFSVTFSFWALLNVIKRQKYSLIYYAISIVLILYSDYLVYLVLIAQLVYIIWLDKKFLKKVFYGMFIGGIFWLPWLSVFPSQLKTGQSAAVLIPGWANVVGGANIKELGLLIVKLIIGRVSFDNKYLYAGIVAPTLLLYGFISFKALKDFSKEVKILLLWILIPVVLAFIISFYIPIFAYFRMVFILPAVAILLGVGTQKFSVKIQKLMVISILLISSILLMVYYSSPKFQRENWKKAIVYVNQSDVVLFEDNNIPAPALYYGCDKNCLPGLKNFPASNESDLSDFETRLTDKIYLFDYLVEISDPNKIIQRKLENLGYKNTATRDFSGVGFVHEYTK